MATHSKICRYLDIPIQHINNRILKDMRRGHTKQETYDLINHLRSKVPGIALRSTLMVGFPGETLEEFQELLDFVREARIDRLGVFTYSPEEGTQANLLKDTVSEKEKQRRAEVLMEMQEGISLEINQQKIGRQIKVIIDRKEGDYYVGRTEFDSPEVDNEVFVEDHPDILLGEFVDVCITSASEFEIFGKIAEN